MSTPQDVSQMTLEQFELESTSLVIQFLAVLTGRTLPTGVVMQAAMNLHRCVASQLPAEAQRELSMALAASSTSALSVKLVARLPLGADRVRGAVWMADIAISMRILTCAYFNPHLLLAHSL